MKYNELLPEAPIDENTLYGDEEVFKSARTFHCKCGALTSWRASVDGLFKCEFPVCSEECWKEFVDDFLTEFPLHGKDTSCQCTNCTGRCLISGEILNSAWISDHPCQCTNCVNYDPSSESISMISEEESDEGTNSDSESESIKDSPSRPVIDPSQLFDAWSTLTQ